MNAQLFIASTIVTTKDVADLAIGEVGIYGTNKYSGRVENATPVSQFDRFFFAVGKKSGDVVNSRDIGVAFKRRKRNLIVKKNSYRPGVKPVFQATIDCLPNGAWDELELIIATNAAFEGFHGIERFQKTYTVVGSFVNKKTLYEAIANEINTVDPTTDKFFDSATGDASGVTITGFVGQTLNVAFLYRPDDEDSCQGCRQCATKVEQLIDGDLGSGTPEFLSDLASRLAYWNGQAYKDSRLWMNSGDDQTIADRSDFYQIRWTNIDQVDESQTEAAFNIYQDLFLAVPENTDTTYVDQVVEGLMGVKIENSAAL